MPPHYKMVTSVSPTEQKHTHEPQCTGKADVPHNARTQPQPRCPTSAWQLHTPDVSTPSTHRVRAVPPAISTMAAKTTHEPQCTGTQEAQHNARTPPQPRCPTSAWQLHTQDVSTLSTHRVRAVSPAISIMATSATDLRSRPSPRTTIAVH